MTSTTNLEHKYRAWVKKLRDLVDTHDLSLDIGISWEAQTDQGVTYSIPNLMFYTARADHIEVFRGLGLVTGWFSIEQAESMHSTLWKYEIKLLVE